MSTYKELSALNERLQNGEKSQVKKEMGFDNLRNKIPTKETHPYLELIQLDNDGRKYGCGWVVDGM